MLHGVVKAHGPRAVHLYVFQTRVRELALPMMAMSYVVSGKVVILTRNG